MCLKPETCMLVGGNVSYVPTKKKYFGQNGSRKDEGCALLPSWGTFSAFWSWRPFGPGGRNSLGLGLMIIGRVDCTRNFATRLASVLGENALTLAELQRVVATTKIVER